MSAILSIITISYNSISYIEKTIKSVIAQKRDKVEYIVIDGGSTDGTIEIIRRYENYITKWISEHDSGISDAFNKGIKNSNGKWIIFMNSGDYFCDENVISEILPLLDTYKDEDGIYGQICLFNEKGKQLKKYGKEKYNYHKLTYVNYVPHQSLFLQRKYFETYGLFDTAYTKAMDYELLLRAGKSLKLMKLDRQISYVLAGGVSQRNYSILINEFKKAIYAHTNNITILVNLYYIIKLLKIYIRKYSFALKF